MLTQKGGILCIKLKSIPKQLLEKKICPKNVLKVCILSFLLTENKDTVICVHYQLFYTPAEQILWHAFKSSAEKQKFLSLGLKLSQSQESNQEFVITQWPTGFLQPISQLKHSCLQSAVRFLSLLAINKQEYYPRMNYSTETVLWEQCASEISYCKAMWCS